MNGFKLWAQVAFLSFALILSGCLNAEFKEYTIKLNPDGSGSGTIKFINLVSTGDPKDSVDQTQSDFESLLNDYVNGSKFESDNPRYSCTGKRFYEENGQLVGEVTFSFSSPDSVGIYRDSSCPCSPVIFYLGTDPLGSETYQSSNGKYLGKNGMIPIVLFDQKLPELKIRTRLSEDMTGAQSLLPLWKSNQNK